MDTQLLGQLLDCGVDRKRKGDGFYCYKHQVSYGTATLTFYSMINIETEIVQCLYFPCHNPNNEVNKGKIERSNYFQFKQLYSQFSLRLSKQHKDSLRECKLWLADTASFSQIVNLAYTLNLGYHTVENEIDYDLLYDQDYQDHCIGATYDDTSWN